MRVAASSPGRFTDLFAEPQVQSHSWEGPPSRSTHISTEQIEREPLRLPASERARIEGGQAPWLGREFGVLGDVTIAVRVGATGIVETKPVIPATAAAAAEAGGALRARRSMTLAGPRSEE